MEKESLKSILNKLNINICNLKEGDIYIENNNIYKIVVPYKHYKNNLKICFGLSRYVGEIDVIGNVKKEDRWSL